VVSFTPLDAAEKTNILHCWEMNLDRPAVARRYTDSSMQQQLHKQMKNTP
jgi:hypothetical protein